MLLVCPALQLPIWPCIELDGLGMVHGNLRCLEHVPQARCTIPRCAKRLHLSCLLFESWGPRIKALLCHQLAVGARLKQRAICTQQTVGPTVDIACRSTARGTHARECDALHLQTHHPGGVARPGVLLCTAGAVPQLVHWHHKVLGQREYGPGWAQPLLLPVQTLCQLAAFVRVRTSVQYQQHAAGPATGLSVLHVCRCTMLMTFWVDSW